MAKQIPNDMIHYAIMIACRLYGGEKDCMFSNACLSAAIMKMIGHKGVIDGGIIRAILTGRTDVIALKGGSHYQMVE